MNPYIDLKRFRLDLDQYRRVNGTTWSTMADQAGVSPAMFTRINKGYAVSLEAFAQLCAAYRLDPIDYMPRNKRNDNTDTTKERSMETTKTLNINGTDFTIDDVTMRHGAAWANGPRTLDAELSDGQTLGNVAMLNGKWLWRLTGDAEWKTPEPVSGPLARYVDQGGREAAIASLLDAITDKYSADKADPWANMPAASATGPADTIQSQTADTTDPWASLPDATPLPMPDPAIDPTAGSPMNPGMGFGM